MPTALTLQVLANRLKFRHLLLLDALQRTRNVNRAAQQINITQPAASKILRDVESLFGFALFERLPRDMRPTELGAQVIRFAQSTLNGAQRFVDELAQLRKGGAGTVVVGAVMGAADVLTASIAALKERRPLLTIKVVEQLSDRLLRALKEQRLDVVVGRLTDPQQHNEFDFEALSPEPVWLVAAAWHPLRRQRRVTLQQLAQWPWIVQPDTSPLRRLLEHAFADANTDSPRNIIETASVFATLQMVQAAPTIAVLPRAIVERYVAGGMLKRLPITLARQPDDYGIVTRKGEALTGAARDFVDQLRLTAHDRIAGVPQSHAARGRGNAGMSTQQARSSRTRNTDSHRAPQ